LVLGFEGFEQGFEVDFTLDQRAVVTILKTNNRHVRVMALRTYLWVRGSEEFLSPEFPDLVVSDSRMHSTLTVVLRASEQTAQDRRQFRELSPGGPRKAQAACLPLCRRASHRYPSQK
jgi:hypothetical protein